MGTGNGDGDLNEDGGGGEYGRVIIEQKAEGRQTDRPVDMTDKTTHGDRDMADNSLGADSWSRYGMVWYGTYGMGWGQESQKSHLSGNSHYQPPYGPYPGRLEPGWDNWMGSGESYPWTLSYAYNYIHTQAVGKSTLSRM